MMDRNTLTALLLITLVLILTPYYMDLVSPPQQRDFELVEENDDPGAVIKSYIDTTTGGGFLRGVGFDNPPNTEENITTIESDLYIAKISSQSGGSVISYKTKEHFSSDSNYVNLIAEENKNNLLLGFRGLSGDDVAVREGWVQQGALDGLYLIKEPLTITYSNNLLGNKITKALTFTLIAI